MRKEGPMTNVQQHVTRGLVMYILITILFSRPVLAYDFVDEGLCKKDDVQACMRMAMRFQDKRSNSFNKRIVEIGMKNPTPINRKYSVIAGSILTNLKELNQVLGQMCAIDNIIEACFIASVREFAQHKLKASTNKAREKSIMN